MKRFACAAVFAVLFAVVLAPFAATPALAQTCVTKALSKDGKPLSGAAKTSAIKRCCEESAVSKDGKPLAGAAKTSYIAKCEKDG
ncbi:MAG: hypothetical protein Q8M26_15130 [Pseudolabrys sp.]|nr:hypothetical protein [Pseudolabrys sp.]